MPGRGQDDHLRDRQRRLSQVHVRFPQANNLASTSSVPPHPPGSYLVPPEQPPHNSVISGLFGEIRRMSQAFQSVVNKLTYYEKDMNYLKRNVDELRNQRAPPSPTQAYHEHRHQNVNYTRGQAASSPNLDTQPRVNQGYGHNGGQIIMIHCCKKRRIFSKF